ncbi:MAG: single-stranded-DNA-specific exonuclease RecJ [Candidatus Gastranaerophilales bacterium]|nr:single-stranded-DNA-specific exonuclease RecJ [Candidatus Gastranaerophilales bacterium]
MSSMTELNKPDKPCNKRWVYPENQPLAPELIKAAGSNIVAKLLLNRGINTSDKIKAFLNPENIELSSPYVFDHMKKSVERINKAITDHEKIIIWGDFDADGVTSTSLIYKALKYLEANVDYYIPERTNEGHGLNSASVCKLISSQKAKLIITVDCGTSNTTEITLAKGLGTDVIVTDHHEPPEVLPPAFAIINPKVQQENKECAELEYLAGVGVAYKLAYAILESNNKESYSEDLLHLAAIGTIADVVPLLGENRTIVTRGLKLIETRRPKPIIKLLESASYKIEKGVSAEMIAFGIAPRINAVGRLREASLAVKLLTSENMVEIEQITKELNYNNQQRQKMCESMFVETDMKIAHEIDLENNRAIILDQSNWHPGIIGIVASKLTEKYNKPAFLISIDEENKTARCSARSVKGLNLHETLTILEKYFVQFGGHAFAAGFSLDLEKVNFNEFKNKLNATVNQNFDSTCIEPVLEIEMDLQPEEVSVEFINELNRLAPFGECNPAPVFSISNLTLKQYKTMGSNNNHSKLFLSDDNNNTFEAVWWQKNCIEASVLDKINLAFCPDINLFGGKTSIQLVIKDLILSSQDCSKKTESVNNTPIIENIEPRWVDHRKKTGVEKVFSNYLKTTKDSVFIYAENKNTLENLGKNPLFKEKIINRLNVEKADQLMLFDLPPDICVLSDLINNSEAKIIHLTSNTFDEINPVEVIKMLSGMLKYAYTNRDGQVNTNEIASKLSISDTAIKSCIELLNQANIINIIDESKGNIKYKFLGSKDLSSITNLKEYSFFVETLAAVDEFRKQLSENETSRVQKLVNTFKSPLTRV